MDRYTDDHNTAHVVTKGNQILAIFKRKIQNSAFLQNL